MEEDCDHSFNPNSFLNTYRRNADQKRLEKEACDQEQNLEKTRKSGESNS